MGGRTVPGSYRHLRIRVRQLVPSGPRATHRHPGVVSLGNGDASNALFGGMAFLRQSRRELTALVELST